MDLRYLSFLETLLLLAALCVGMPIQQNDNSDYDECDSTIWDYGHGSEVTSGVRNILAHCTAGHISWKNQGRGAIQVSMQPSFRIKTKYFEACFLIKTVQNNVQVSIDERHSPLQKLVLLSQDKPEMGREMCYRAASSQPVILYLETVHTDSNELSHLGQVELDYDIQPVTSLAPPEDMEECKPCTEDEVLEQVCTSDFVLKGSMMEVSHHEGVGETDIHLYVSHIHHQTDGLFRASDEEEEEEEDTASFSQGLSSQARSRGSHASPPFVGGSVTVPRKCGIHHGRGEFLFTGRIRLGRALLRCAPRVEEFERLWKRAIKTGKNRCVL